MVGGRVTTYFLVTFVTLGIGLSTFVYLGRRHLALSTTRIVALGILGAVCLIVAVLGLVWAATWAWWTVRSATL